MKSSWKTYFQSLAGTLTAILLLVLVVAVVAAVASNKQTEIEDGSYLVVELHGDLLEYDPPGGPMSMLTGGETETLQRILDNLAKAQVDERVAGVVLKVSWSSAAGFAKTEEIRAAVHRLRASGKKVYAWAESFEAQEVPLLAACDEVFTPPTAYIQFAGFASGSTHIKQALDKLGIRADLHKIKDYKSAAEMMIREDLSEPARENREWMMEEVWTGFAGVLSQDRGLSEEQIVALMEHAVFTAEEAKEGGLVDRLLYWDEVEALLKAEGEEKLATVSQARYAEEPPEDFGLEGDKTIAVVHAQGMITGRENGVSPLFGITMGHESIVAELRRAREDEDVAAVVFRVDSQGGEALASDLMGHEVEITAAVKPVVVSMVDVAASGGYHISYRASRILADPTTVTGSIGSISGKFNLAGLYDKLGFTHDVVTKGPMAEIDSDRRDFTPEERVRFEANHWDGFNHWLRDVAEHRGMSFEEAELLAHGRVWTGRQAVDNGLVDELGDFARAVEVAKQLAGISADTAVTVAHYPEKKSLLASVLGGDTAAAARWAVWRLVREDVVETWQRLQREPGLVAAAF